MKNRFGNCKGAKITLELFDDRVEISNPGGLTAAISAAEFGTKSHSRNPLIFGLFVRIQMVEQVGSGIGRIREQMKVAGLPKPDFKTDGLFTVVLHRILEKTAEKTVEKITLSETAGKIVNLIRKRPDVTTNELATALGITGKGVEYHMAKLQKSGVVYREGSKKTGIWKVKE